MTTPITYPPGQVTTWGINEALKNQSTWISYIGVDGSIWYLTGPLSPIAGAQDGIVVKKFMGLMSPFKMLEQQGARQDGATWQAAVYDPGEIMFSLEASGSAPQNIRDVLRHWIAAWDARQTGTLSVFTPDQGEWWCPVRMGKNIPDMFTQDYTWSGKQELTWSAKNYDAFWYSVDSTSTFNIAYNSVGENFGGQSNSSTLNAARWTQLISPANGGYGIYNGAAYFSPSNNAAPTNVININATQSATNNQVVSVTLGGAHFYNLFDFLDAGANFDIYARLNASGTQYARLSVGPLSHSLYLVNGGSSTQVFSIATGFPPYPGETWSLIAGTNLSPYQYIVQRHGLTVMDYTDSAGAAVVGASNRYSGFGVQTDVVLGNVIIPPPISEFSAGDNAGATQSGFINLTNFGDQPAWPRFLCYGPGIFTLPNGPGGQTINFGPLDNGQVVLVTTDPQYRSVVDITPGQQFQVLSPYQQIIEGLISFVTANNVPPLLQQFESLFGILPPQGNLFSLLGGRFTYSLPGATYGVQPVTATMPVGITNGGPTSMIIAAITPRRRWPL